MFHPGASSDYLLISEFALVMWMIFPAEGTFDCRSDAILAQEMTV